MPASTAPHRQRSVLTGLRLRTTLTVVAVVALSQGVTWLAWVDWGELLSGQGPSGALTSVAYRALAVGALVGVLGGTLAAQLLARSVTSPLGQLTRSATRLQRGEYQIPVSSTRRDEFGALAATLDEMRTAILRREEQVLQMAYADQLTQLANRSRFQERLKALLAEEPAAPRAVISMDLDRFKDINDTLGHAVGDYVLRQVAERLRVLLNGEDVLARLGGDEFALLLHDGRAQRAAAVAREVRRVLCEPFWYDRQPLDVGVSIGVARSPAHGSDALTLLRNAEAAMYVCKREHREVVEYVPEGDRREGQLSLLSDLRRAMDAGQLQLYFQPKISVRRESVRSVEALVRWIHPERGLVPPDLFIPFAEQTGFIKHLTLWAIEAALAQCAAWRDEGIALQVAVNVSTRDLTTSRLPQQVHELLRLYRLPPRALCLEITESGFMSEPQQALKVLDELAALGVKLAIDDYGTGYSSLSYLMRLPVHELKIDRAFVSDIGTDQRLATIVRSTVALGHNLGLSVVAEGVEDEAAWHCLTQCACDAVQGYYFAPPLPANELTLWILGRAVPGQGGDEHDVAGGLSRGRSPGRLRAHGQLSRAGEGV